MNPPLAFKTKTLVKKGYPDEFQDEFARLILNERSQVAISSAFE
jgi:hypothetical protein